MNDLRHLLLLLDDDPHAEARIGQAIALARTHGARLAGLAVTGFADLAAGARAASALAELAGTSWAQMETAAQHALARFEAASRAAGLTEVDAHLVRGESDAALLHATHCCDLLLLGRPLPATRAMTEALLHHGARPALLLPPTAQAPSAATRALVAWDDSRAAVRAVADALPLLRRCATVTLVGWHAAAGHEAAQLSLARLSHWLAQHGIAATLRARVLPEGGHLGEALLSQAADEGAGLLVMGAWGHSRRAEQLLGGTTRAVLDAMTLPVLMSH